MARHASRSGWRFKVTLPGEDPASQERPLQTIVGAFDDALVLRLGELEHDHLRPEETAECLAVAGELDSAAAVAADRTFTIRDQRLWPSGRFLREYGVTVFSQEDALEILAYMVFRGQEMPDVLEVLADVNVRDLDQGHVIPNMGPRTGAASGTRRNTTSSLADDRRRIRALSGIGTRST